MDNSEPERVTIDQIVALNMRYWRREAGMTQEELGELVGWSAANVSAAERSADPGRERRRFDAQTLAALSLALGVPLVALFLPPPDGSDCLFTGSAAEDGGKEYDMRDLMARVVMPDSEEDSRPLDAYRIRLRAAVDTYLNPAWSKEVARWLKPLESRGVRADRVAQLLARRDDLLVTAEVLADLAGAISEDLEDEQ